MISWDDENDRDPPVFTLGETAIYAGLIVILLTLTIIGGTAP